MVKLAVTWPHQIDLKAQRSTTGQASAFPPDIGNRVNRQELHDQA